MCSVLYKVLLGEVSSSLDSSQVVVKELRSSASVQDQIHFLEEAQPYRALQHPALLQCLAQCSEATPYLLIMEFCPLGDLKGYLRSCRAADSMTPDPYILLRMACEISSGLQHLHKHNFIHSDLALRNCLLTSDLTVKIGDYGLSQSKYKDDYFVTPDQLWVPLRWIGPELIDEVHGNLLLVDQTKPSNIWSLGVTMWEVLELGKQPYRHYTDQQVLTCALKEQHLKLPKPLLELPMTERWYEVMQFCWLPPEQRPNAEEVHLLVTYLCAKGVSEAEDEFEKRWNSLRPNGGHAPTALAPPSASSFPLLQHFPPHPEPGDDILTVTETSRGLNFEYQWEQARPKPPRSASGQGSYRDAFYPPPAPSGLTLGMSPSYYEPKQLPPANVLTAPSPTLSSEYYIRIEGHGLDYPVCPYSPEYQGSSGSASFLTGSGDSGDCLVCPALPRPDSYWSADFHKAADYDWDGSPALSLTTEPLLGIEPCSSPSHPWEIGPAHPCSSPAHSTRLWETGRYVSYKDRDGGYYYEPPPSLEVEPYLSEPPQESWGSRSLRQALGELENPLGISPSVCSPNQGYSSAPYLQGKSTAGGRYFDVMEPLRNTMPRMARGGTHHHINPHLFTPPGWASNRSSNNNSLQSRCRPAAMRHFHYTMPSTYVEDSWLMTEPAEGLSCYGQDDNPLLPPKERHAYIYLCPAGEGEADTPRLRTEEGPQFIDPLTGVMVRSYAARHREREKSLPPVTRGGAAGLGGEVGGVALKAEAWRRHPGAPEEPASVSSHAADSGMEQGSSSISLVDIYDCSDDDDITDITSGVFVDCPTGGSDSGERGTPDLSPTLKQAGTPDSIDSIDVPPSPALHSPSPAAFSPPSSAPFHPPSPPKALDSGYDTENNESPEFVLKEPHDLRDSGGSIPPSGNLTPSGEADEAPPPVAVLSGLSENMPYRDSAYFSDCDAEGERAMQEQGAEPLRIMATEEICPLLAKQEEEIPPEIRAEHRGEGSSSQSSAPSVSSQPTASLAFESTSEESSAAILLDNKEEEESNKALPEVEEVGQVKEVKDEKELEEVEEEEIVKEVEEVAEVEEKVMQVNEEAGEVRVEVDVVRDMKEEEGVQEEVEVVKDKEGAEEIKQEEKEIEVEVMTEVNVVKEVMEEVVKEVEEEVAVVKDMKERAEKIKQEEKEIEVEVMTEVNVVKEVMEEVVKEVEEEVEVVKDMKERAEKIKQEEKEIEVDVMTEVNVVKEVMEEVVKEVEVVKDMKERAEEIGEKEEEQEVEVMTEVNVLKEGEEKDSSPGGVTEEVSGPQEPVLGGRASPGEEGDSEDSEESDEEVRSNSVQEQSEEDSEEESQVVPLVVSDGSNACLLRSLLRASLSPTQERKAKVVSFFHDVTIYLFDQESPTRELVQQDLSMGAEPGGRGSDGLAAPPAQERVSDDSSDGNLSEESAGFEWEDDFPLLSSPSLMTSSSEAQPTVQFSRFSVSRFSITHVTDSDMDSAGGSSEDGERE
ncbi:hypothetical protein SKAU_G00029910 [Synaphobranchus kaupii]|uniref:Protein kinase domain-containing protein n=1 Tax=Synaphobranchus kaupii TaxID=118154 RepID=A0A9Q1JE00_SYNKA|nr:hypothetical protein SKAU_G00029910 [Synaphobranchus kaupii]